MEINMFEARGKRIGKAIISMHAQPACEATHEDIVRMSKGHIIDKVGVYESVRVECGDTVTIWGIVVASTPTEILVTLGEYTSSLIDNN